MAYTYQAPKDLAAQSAKFKAKHPDLTSVVATGNYEAQLKYDGVFSASYTSDATSYSRQGELQICAEKLAIDTRKLVGPGHLVFMELWIPGTLHKTINGLARKQSVQETLHGRIFDMISQDDFAKGKCETPYAERLDKIRKLFGEHEKLQAAHCMTATGMTERQLLQQASDLATDDVSAFDGLILRDMTAPWRQGAAKLGEVLRVKAGLSLDLRVTGQVAVERDTKLGGFLTVTYNGVPTDVGSGLTQEMLQGILNGTLDFRGKVIEVYCLGITPAGKLREPRFKSVRHDTLPEEDKDANKARN